MAAARTRATRKPLNLTKEEREHLLTILEPLLRDKQIEEHRTDSIDFKEHVQHQEALLQRIINKLRRA